MTVLQIMSESGATVLRTGDAARIGEELAPHGVRFERWTAGRELAPGAGSDEVLAAYREEVERIRESGGFTLIDVVRMRPDDGDPAWPQAARAAREKFLNEHRHDEDEVRFFVEGRGCFYLHLRDRVYAVVCEAGDLLSVPTGTRHWFDMGERPEFCAIRFFQEEDGWVGDFTGDPIASAIPSLDELLAPVS
ncbi:1,2-dihydroxy-3-keto-5-methylthiopentene dioxygenase [Nonomuraea sp. NPDC004297]